MHKSLNFKLRRSLIAQDGDILQGHLPGQHHPLCAHFVGGAGSCPVGDAGLGRKMHVNVRGKGLTGIQHTKVCHDKGIHTGFGSLLDGLRQTVGLLVGGQGVHGQVDLATTGVGVDNAFRQLLRGEISRGRAHTKLRQAAVNGIGTVVDGITQTFRIARRGKQFRDL